jgi:hypothetical protein
MPVTDKDTHAPTAPHPNNSGPSAIKGGVTALKENYAEKETKPDLAPAATGRT